MISLASVLPADGHEDSAEDMSEMMDTMRNTYNAMFNTFCSHPDTIQCVADNQAVCAPEEDDMDDHDANGGGNHHGVDGGDDHGAHGGDDHDDQGLGGGDDDMGGGGDEMIDILDFPCLCTACASATASYLDFQLEAMNFLISAFMGEPATEAEQQASAMNMLRLQCEMVGAMECYSANAECAAVVAEMGSNQMLTMTDAATCSASNLPTTPRAWGSSSSPSDDSPTSGQLSGAFFVSPFLFGLLYSAFVIAFHA